MSESRKSIWILSDLFDAHTRVITKALESTNIKFDLVDSSKFPAKDHLEHRIDSENQTARFCVDAEYLSDLDCSLVWIRRPKASKSHISLHPEDREFALLESDAAIRGVLYSMEFRGVKFINPLVGRTLAQSKALQLELAQSSGLRIPNTLFSNNTKAIRDFAAKQRWGCVYKQVAPTMFPANAETPRHCLTTAITLSDLLDDATIRSTPGCYQALVPKAFDVRALYLDGELLCAGMRSRNFVPFEADFRRHGSETLDVWPICPPKQVIDRCKALALKLGVIFGSLDFVVDDNDDWYFLEINEAGQFLFVEYLNPDIMVLAAFIEMMSKISDIQVNPASRKLRLQNFYSLEDPISK